ncbi:hypothetical protein ACFLUZ_04465 [Chloroflexota bacterium]
MKKVLIIGFLYPLTLSSAGSWRMLPLAKHLSKFGWEPIALTSFLVKKSDLPFRVIETPYRHMLDFWIRLFRFNRNEDITVQVKRRFGINRKKSLIDIILTLGTEIFHYPEGSKGWKSVAVKASEELFAQENIDAIISCRPITSYLVGSELTAKFKVPWIADLTDLWSQNHYYRYGTLRQWLDRRLELKTLAKADALVTNSRPWADKLQALHKRETVYAITHGFDPAEVNIPPVGLTTKFTITYTGNIYSERQDPSKFFAVLQELLNDGTMDPNDIDVRFYGRLDGWLEKEIEKYGLSDIVKQCGIIPREDVLKKQAESQLLLLLDWDDPQEKGVYGGKVFEYMAARRPVLATGGSDDNVTAELLDETKAGIHAVTEADIKHALRELYQEYKLKGGIAYKGEESKISKYSHHEMARKFAEVLDSLT